MNVLKLDSLISKGEYATADELIQKIQVETLDKSSMIKFFYCKGKLNLNLGRLNESYDAFSEGAMQLGVNSISIEAFDFCYYRGVVARELRHMYTAQEQINRGRQIAKSLNNKTFLYESEFLQSNLFNAQEKYDSAVHYMVKAKSFLDTNNYSKLSKIENNLGVLHMEMQEFEKALAFFDNSLKLVKNVKGHKLGQFYINIADCYLELNELEQGQEFMKKALNEAEETNNQRQLSQVLRLKIKFLALSNGLTEIITLDKLADDLEHDVIDSTVHDLSIKHNVQFKDTQIAEQGVVIKKTEKAALNRLKGMLVLGILMLGSFLLFYFYNKNQKIKHELALSKEIIRKQQALTNERTRIAAEMHDDLGGGLTKIKFLGQKMLRQAKDIEQKEKLNKIVANSQSLVSNMSEIIWAMNPGFDTLENLIAYARRYSSEYLRDHEIRLSFKADDINQRFEFSGEKRRHVFLVYKELLHNIVKHAGATEVAIAWKIIDNKLSLIIEDNGIGMNEIEEANDSDGNGLRNMKMRIEKLGGEINWFSNKGLTTEIKLPLVSQDLEDKLN